ncbi:MAG: hypothetical protein ACI9J3_001239, partial [Parvicellaceae bacterium]
KYGVKKCGFELAIKTAGFKRKTKDNT